MTMISTIVSRRVLLWSPPGELPSIPEVNLKAKEQECLHLLKRCQNMGDFNKSHASILKWGFLWNSFCASNLLATCALSDWGSMELACSIFYQMQEPGTFDFNTMIKGYAKDLNFIGVMYLFCEMLERSVRPDKYTYPFLLKACADEGTAPEGKQLHGQIVKLGLAEDVYVANSLINTYGKCKEIGHSCSVFGQMKEKDVASWSSIISAHASLKMWEDCFSLLRQMLSETTCRPEESILVSILSGCTYLTALDLGRSTHAALLRRIDKLNVVAETSLMDMYAKCGCVDKAITIFEGIPRKNEHSYSVVISALAMHGRATAAVRMFSNMLDEGLRPDDAVYVGVLSACSHGGLVEEGVKAFEKMKKDKISPTVKHYGCMVDLMARSGRLKEAMDVVMGMHVKPNDVIWRSFLGGCKLHGDVEMAEMAFKNLADMEEDTPADHLMLASVYARAQRWNDVEALRRRMEQKGVSCSQTAGFCLVEVGRKLQKFVSQEKRHPEWKQTYEMVYQMEWQARFEGYVPDLSQVLLEVGDDAKREKIRGHSQKLALAFALQNTRNGAPVRIFRNFRMCGDCHEFTKMISMVYDRSVVVRDQHRFHHFKDGACSCKDYW